MSVWPRSLLWRAATLVAVLLVATQVGSLWLFLNLGQDRRPKEFLERTVESVKTLRESALQIIPEQRHVLLLDQAKRMEVWVYRYGEVEPPWRMGRSPLRAKGTQPAAPSTRY